MRFYTKFDKLTKWITIITILIIVAFGVWIYMRSASSFMPAWMTILLGAILLLVIMSIPRFNEVTPDGLEINCLLEITFIPFKDIKRVKLIQPSDLKWSIPVAGVFGFFGYYGYYLNLRKWHLFKLYSKNRRGYVMVETIFEKRYVLGVSEPLELIMLLERHNK